MADIGVSYNIGYTPNPVTVNADLSIRGTQARVSLRNVPRVLVTATPRFTKNVVSSAISVIATPLANAITASLGFFAGDVLNNKSFDVFKIDPIEMDVEGIDITLTPSGLSMGQFNNMLMITGDLKVK